MKKLALITILCLFASIGYAGTFVISAPHTEAIANIGGFAAYQLDLEGKNGFFGTVTLFITTGLPPHVHTGFDPPKVTLSPGKPLATSQLTLTLPNNIIPGSYVFKVFAIAENGQLNGLTLTLHVRNLPPPTKTIKEIFFIGRNSGIAPFNIPAGTFFDIAFDTISVIGTFSIVSTEAIVFEASFSSNSGTIKDGPYQVILGPGGYALIERYSGSVSGFHPLIGEFTATIHPVTIIRLITVGNTATYTIEINTTVRNLKTQEIVEGHLTVSGDIEGVIGHVIPLRITTLKAIDKGQTLSYAAESRATLESDTSLHKLKGTEETLAPMLIPLASGVPKETRLVSNFPNPFNPETWMPYQLAEDARVIVQIYNSSGSPVRTLSVGFKPAGSYLTRERAAHWDGRNQFGEFVSSGVYFYHLQAEDFSATKKMLILK